MKKKIFFQIKNIFKLTGLQQGQEFKVAIEQAKKKNINIVYGDVNAQEIQNKIMQIGIGEFSQMSSRMNSIPPHQLSTLKSLLYSNDIEVSLEDIKNREFVRNLSDILKTVSPDLHNIIITGFLFIFIFIFYFLFFIYFYFFIFYFFLFFYFLVFSYFLIFIFYFFT